MATRTTKTSLNILLTELKEVSNKPDLFLDHAACYGGYRLVNVVNTAHHGVFGLSSCANRVSAKEMYNMLDCLIKGFKEGKKL